MRSPSTRVALRAALLAFVLAWTGCGDIEEALTAPEAPSASRMLAPNPQGIEQAIAAQERHSESLMALPGVVGTAVGLLPDGEAAVSVFVTASEQSRIPESLDGVPVRLRRTGMFVALSDPTTRARPAPLGFSVGHPDITAGSIGARVVDAGGNVYVLSNNHVLAASNGASIGDPALQPGPYDGGTQADAIGTLADYYVIDFSFSGYNTMDAAIARTTTAQLGNATPLDDGYGAPSSDIWGDADGDGRFDDVGAMLGLGVQKYGRTTALTVGAVTEVNAFIEVCYVVFYNLCLTSGYFYDQVVIGTPGFSGGGDSGSLIVTDDATAHPVALLFAGSDTHTIGNRIDLVLDHFGVAIDGDAGTPPAPVTDVAIATVDAPASVVEGDPAEVVVAVDNVGNQDAGSFTVTLRDLTAGVDIDAQLLPGLSAGVGTDVTFTWSTAGAALGDHQLEASHDLADDDAGNDQATATVAVLDPSAPATVHVGDLDGSTSDQGGTWTALVRVTVHDAAHAPVTDALVSGDWDLSNGSFSCTTATDGTCTVSLSGIRKRTKAATFAVASIVPSGGATYDDAANHDPDGESDGTAITVAR